MGKAELHWWNYIIAPFELVILSEYGVSSALADWVELQKYSVTCLELNALRDVVSSIVNFYVILFSKMMLQLY